MELKLMTYNIHHGEGMDQKVDLERIAAIIRHHAPDVVGLEEVDQGTERSGGVQQAEVLSNLTGLGVVFGASFPFEGGEYGNAFLSRWPILGSSLESLPSPLEEEQRSLLSANLDCEGREIRMMVTHLNQKNEQVRSAQANHIAGKLENLSGPTILMGDLNAPPESIALQSLTRSMAITDASNKPTYPSIDPVMKIDYILYDRLSDWEVVTAEVPDEPLASDHRPVCATLKLEN